MTIEEKIWKLAAPIAEDYEVELLKVSVSQSRVALYVDARGGVDSDVLAQISRGVALQLDVEDLISGKYQLEVTSPGLDWPLTTQADFDRYEGDWLRVVFDDGQAIEGENKGLTDDLLSLRDEQGKLHQVNPQDTTKIVRAINWKRVSARQK